MDMLSVSSSDVAAIGYDSDSATVRIEFIKGGSYDYHSVPIEIYEGLVNASSKGKYVNEFIKKAGYAFSKL